MIQRHELWSNEYGNEFDMLSNDGGEWVKWEEVSGVLEKIQQASSDAEDILLHAESGDLQDIISRIWLLADLDDETMKEAP
jgi:hypothetical protein